MKQLLSFLLFTVLCCSAHTHAQTTRTQEDTTAPRFRFGVYGAYNLVQHDAQFRTLPDVPICCNQNFTSVLGNGFTAGLLAEVPFSKAVWLSLRASYTTYGAEFTQDTSLLVISRTTGTSTNTPLRHNFAMPLANIGFEPLLLFKPFGATAGGQGGFNLAVGGRIGYVLQRTFSYTESLSNADGTVFKVENATVRNQQSGTIPLANTLAAAVLAGVSYDIPLNKQETVLLAPEVFVAYSLMPVIPSTDWQNAVPNNAGAFWNAHQLRLGLALKIAPPKKRDTPPTPPDTASTETTDNPPRTEPPPPPQTKGRMNASLTAVGVEWDGREFPNITFRIEEFLSNNLRPLLPYIFFEQGSDNIPDRYDRLPVKETAGFFVDKLHNSEMLETYHHIMNIVGRRMTQYPAAKLTITGCNDNVNIGEKGNTPLSYRRAKAVRDYLANVWSIDTARLPIQVRGLTSVPTVSATGQYVNEVHQENRRVELASDTWEILEPIKTSDTVRTASPPIIRLRPRVQNPSGGVKEWRVTVEQNGQVLKEFSGTGAIPQVLDWNIAQNQNTVPKAPTPLECKLFVTDNSGENIALQQDMNVDQITIQRKRRERINDKEIDRYSLILFDFDKFALTPTHERIAQYIKSQISPSSTVRISGYTDYTNPLEYSLRLSKARARETAEALSAGKRGEVRGLGKTILLYDTEIPEGRFYCRTVNIVVETPIAER